MTRSPQNGDSHAPANGAAGLSGDGRRTFVISDVHGYPELIENALDHGAFRDGVDDLIFAGDFVDRGPDAEGCLALLERYATRTLVGNHELAVLLGFPLFEQTPDSLGLRQTLLDRVLARTADAWRAVTVVNGILISHAGVSSAYQGLWRDVGRDPYLFASRLNEQFLEAVVRELETGRVGGCRYPRRTTDPCGFAPVSTGVSHPWPESHR